MKRAFPAIYAKDVERMAKFYKDLGFSEQVRMPEQDSPGYIGLKRDETELAITTIDSPKQLIGIEVGTAPRFEMFIYVDNVGNSFTPGHILRSAMNSDAFSR